MLNIILKAQQLQVIRIALVIEEAEVERGNLIVYIITCCRIRKFKLEILVPRTFERIIASAHKSIQFPDRRIRIAAQARAFFRTLASEHDFRKEEETAHN